MSFQISNHGGVSEAMLPDGDAFLAQKFCARYTSKTKKEILPPEVVCSY